MPLIRPEKPGDAAAIRAVIKAAFRQAEHVLGLPFGPAPGTGRIAYHAAFGLPD